MQPDLVHETYRKEADCNKSQAILCEACQVRYSFFCPNCDMLALITSNNRSRVNGRADLTLPNEVLCLYQSSFEGESIVARRSIPAGVIFGPYKGFPPVKIGTKDIWKIKNSRFLDVSNVEDANWMVYVNASIDVNDCNLVAVENNNELYFQSFKRIIKGEELVLFNKTEPYFSGKGYIEPEVVKFNIFYCCYDCCLGYSTDRHLELHKRAHHATTSVDHYFSCDVCLKKFSEKCNYDEHLSNCFANCNLFDIYSCYICNANFDRRSEHQDHARTHIISKGKDDLLSEFNVTRECFVLLEKLDDNNVVNGGKKITKKRKRDGGISIDNCILTNHESMIEQTPVVKVRKSSRQSHRRKCPCHMCYV